MSDEIPKMPSDGGDKQRMGPFLEGPGFAQIASRDQRYDQKDRSSSAAGGIRDRATDYWRQLSEGMTRVSNVIRDVPELLTAKEREVAARRASNEAEIALVWLNLTVGRTPEELVKRANARAAWNEVLAGYLQTRIHVDLIKARMWRTVGSEMSAARAELHGLEYASQMLLYREQAARNRDRAASYRAQMQGDQPENAGPEENTKSGESL